MYIPDHREMGENNIPAIKTPVKLYCVNCRHFLWPNYVWKSVLHCRYLGLQTLNDIPKGVYYNMN